jgi:DNA-directed RNA polymerase subunit beta'
MCIRDSTEIVIYDEVGREKLRQKLPNGARLLVEPDAMVAADQILAEWDPHTVPVITEAKGSVVYQDMVEGISYREVVDETTGKAIKEVIDWRQSARSGNLRPSLLLVDGAGKPVQLPSGAEARYYLPVNALLSVDNGQAVIGGDVLARLPKEASKTRDITGGLPRVAELFEARRPKDPAIIADIEGRVEFGKDYKNKRRLKIVPAHEDVEPVEYLIPKGKHVIVQEGDLVKPGDPIVEGNAVPHDILRVLGVSALARFLVNEIQDVYLLQGVKINDKHVEVIVRQMLQKIEIVDPGDTTFLVGEQVDRTEFDRVNERMIAEERRPASAFPVLQGITKASLQTQSFISAASFQETTRVLTEAAFAGKVDKLGGLKENVIVGRLIPAGTGGVLQRLKKLKSGDERFAPPEDLSILGEDLQFAGLRHSAE